MLHLFLPVINKFVISIFTVIFPNETYRCDQKKNTLNMEYTFLIYDMMYTSICTLVGT